MIKAYAVKCKFDIIATHLTLFESLLSIDEKRKIGRLKNHEDRLRSIYSRVLMRKVICERIGIENSKLDIALDSYGRPFINHNLDINSSHSGVWAVCAISNKKVAIDIEKIEDINHDVIDMCFHKLESNDIYNMPYERQIEYFYDLWTLKESYVKLDGRGLNIDLDSFYIKKEASTIHISQLDSSEEISFKQYEIDDNYKLSLCTYSDQFSDEIEIVKISDLIEFCKNK